jgi:RND family efflux transporter MFP subunit
MKKLSWIFIGIFILTACASSTPVAEVTLVSSSSNTNIDTQSDSDTVIASGVIEPAQVSEIAFSISALVKDIPVTEGQSAQAGDTLMVLNTPDLEYAVIAAEEDYKARVLAAELQKADKVLYVNPNTGEKSWLSLPKEVYLKALAIADQSKAAWDSASATLAQNTITAPFDGTVVDVLATTGGTVQANQTVIILADLNHLQISTTDLSERDIANVKIGQSVNVKIEALGIDITGRVTRISPIAETIGGDVVFPVTIELDEQPDGLLWGMSAEVEIQTDN